MEFAEGKLVFKKPRRGIDRSNRNKASRFEEPDFGFGTPTPSKESQENSAEKLKKRKGTLEKKYNRLVKEMNRGGEILPKISKITQDMDNMRNFFDEYDSAAQFSNALLQPDITGGEIIEIADSTLGNMSNDQWVAEQKKFDRELENLSKLLDDFESTLELQG